MTDKTIAIIGAGLAGLSCAQRLTEQGFKPHVFDKGRSPGGRMATRRVETPHGMMQFDHGAQFFTVRDQRFALALKGWLASNTVAPWRATDATQDPNETHFVGTPGMSALPRHLAQNLTVQVSTRISHITPAAAGHYLLHAEDGQTFGPFQGVIVATPAKQAAALLDPIAPAFAEQARHAQTAPCWAGLFAFEAETSFPVDALRLKDHPVLAWAARDSSKPGRPAGLQAWVAHATPAWSKANIEASADETKQALELALVDLLGVPAPILGQAHRWRFAQVEKASAPNAPNWDAERHVGVCGDWRRGPRVEAAWLSGFTVAEEVAG
jgi:predicted NAD/FAD-dependent oxidoreductase